MARAEAVFGILRWRASNWHVCWMARAKVRLECFGLCIGHVRWPQRIGFEIITTTNIAMMWVGARACINEMFILFDKLKKLKH